MATDADQIMAALGVTTALALVFAAGAAVELVMLRRRPRRGVEVVDRRKYEQALRMVDSQRRAMAEMEVRCEAAESALAEERYQYRVGNETEETIDRFYDWARRHGVRE